MNYIYIGDRQLDPPEDIECSFCDGFGFVDEWDCVDEIWYKVDCLHCHVEEDPEPDTDPAI